MGAASAWAWAAETAPTSQGSQWTPATAAASRTLRALDESLDARARTASRTVAGMAGEPLARISVTKNGLPPVRRYSPAGSRPLPSASVRTAASVRRGSVVRRAPSAVARSPT